MAFFGGALWATSRTGTNRTIGLLALLWIPVSAAVAVGTWSRWKFAGEMKPISLPNRITGGVLLTVLFGGIDAWVVYGEAAWRPITGGIGVAFLLMGWTTDWRRIPPTPTWQRPLRQLGYYGLTLVGLILTPFVEPFQAMLFFMFAELFVPRLHKRIPSADSAREIGTTPDVQ